MIYTCLRKAVSPVYIYLHACASFIHDSKPDQIKKVQKHHRGLHGLYGDVVNKIITVKSLIQEAP